MKNTPFDKLVGSLSKGGLNDELTEVMAKVVKKVRDTGKAGSVTLQLKVSMLSKNDEDAVKLSPIVKVSVPEGDRAESIMWSTADGDLMRNDPKHEVIEAKVLVKEDQPTKTLGNQTPGNLRKVG